MFERNPAGTVAWTASTSSNAPFEGRLGPAGEGLEERGRLQVELPVGHDPAGELLGRAAPGLEALDRPQASHRLHSASSVGMPDKACMEATPPG